MARTRNSETELYCSGSVLFCFSEKMKKGFSDEWRQFHQTTKFHFKNLYTQSVHMKEYGRYICYIEYSINSIYK